MSKYLFSLLLFLLPQVGGPGVLTRAGAPSGTLCQGAYACWIMNTSYGDTTTNWLDHSGNGQNIVVGTPANLPFEAGSCCSMPGSIANWQGTAANAAATSYASTNIPANCGSACAFYVTFWTYQSNSTGTMFSNRNSTQQGIIIYQSNTVSTLMAICTSGCGTITQGYVNFHPVGNVLTLVYFGWDGTNTVRINFNGVEQTVSYNATSFSGSAAPNAPVMLGQDGAAAGNPFANGVIMNVCFAQGSLSVPELVTFAANGINPALPCGANPVLHS